MAGGVRSMMWNGHERSKGRRDAFRSRAGREAEEERGSSARQLVSRVRRGNGRTSLLHSAKHRSWGGEHRVEVLLLDGGGEFRRGTKKFTRRRQHPREPVNALPLPL